MQHVIDAIAALEVQLAAKREEAVAELRAKKVALAQEIEQLDRQMAELTLAGAKTGTRRRRREPEKTCPVCGEQGHDGRRHRADRKKSAKKGA